MGSERTRAGATLRLRCATSARLVSVPVSTPVAHALQQQFCHYMQLELSSRTWKNDLGWHMEGKVKRGEAK
eukprot:6186783-Pleurochrysis_carterae.AAC.1